MSQKLKYNKESDEGYFLEVDVQYPEKLYKLHNDLPFLLDGKILKKVEKLVTNFLDKNKYVIHIRNFNQALNHGLISEKVHWVIKFNQEDWLKPYIAMNTQLRLRAKKYFSERFFQVKE